MQALTIWTVERIQSLKLNHLKSLVYNLFNQLSGAKVTQTKQLKRYKPSTDFRHRANWEQLALHLQARLMNKANNTEVAIAS